MVTQKNSRAFTLLELLIVMIVILIIMSFTAPWLLRIRAKSQLNNAAQTLQNEISLTRMQAMRSGTPYVFRYRSRTGSYEILPKDVYDSYAPKQSGELSDPETSLAQVRSLGYSANESDAASPFGTQSDFRDGGTAGGAYLKTLPLRFVFGAIPLSSSRNEETDPNALTAIRGVGTAPLILSETPQSLAPPEAEWSEPILFYPNGRTSSGSLSLRSGDEYNYKITLSLRGLTGSVHLGQVQLGE